VDIEDLKADLGCLLDDLCTADAAEAAFADDSSAVVARLKADGYVRDPNHDRVVDADKNGQIESHQFAFRKNGIPLVVAFDHREGLYNASTYELYDLGAGELVPRLEEIYVLTGYAQASLGALSDTASPGERVMAHRAYVASTNTTNVMRYQLGLDLPEQAHVSRYLNQTVLVPDEIAQFQVSAADTVEVNFSGGLQPQTR
jgi:hypothetical protein